MDRHADGLLIVRIVSGGQSGVDRGALDAAIDLGVDYAGWCPRGGWAEDFPEPPGLMRLYPGLRETPSEDPAERTALNVRDSDATLLVRPSGVQSPGCDLTAEIARDLTRPVFECRHPAEADAAADIRAWLDAYGHALSLNVAGPRESEASGIHAATRLLLRALLEEDSRFTAGRAP